MHLQTQRQIFQVQATLSFHCFQLYRLRYVRKYGFLHLHISSLGHNIISLFSMIWVKICEKIWVYALACCRGREKSEGEDGGLRYTVTRLFTTFQCFSSICIIVFLNNIQNSSSFSRMKIIWFVFGYTQGQFECHQTFILFCRPFVLTQISK